MHTEISGELSKNRDGKIEECVQPRHYHDRIYTFIYSFVYFTVDLYIYLLA